jgi:hypothetical protein
MVTHKLLKGKICITLLIFLSGFTLAQSGDSKLELLKSNQPLYTAFNKFYTDSIRQESKDEWGNPYYYKIDRVYGLNYFDYNKDGTNDALVEFSVHPSDSWIAGYSIAVLLGKNKDTFEYVTHFLPVDNQFLRFESSYFLFSGSDNEDSTEKYLLKANRFILIKESQK